MVRTVVRLMRRDGIIIEKVIEKDMPIISAISSNRIGPWSEGDRPFCPVTLTPLIFERRENGVYAEISPEGVAFGLEDIFPDRAMCQETGRNPPPDTSKEEDTLATLSKEDTLATLSKVEDRLATLFGEHEDRDTA